MVYSQYFTDRHTKVPVPLTLILVFVILFFLARLFNVTPPSSRASKKYLKQLQLVNPSYNQMGIYWQTDQKETGWILLGEKESELKRIVLDDRDTPKNKTSYLHHYVLLTDLKPQTRYYYKVVSNNVLIGDVKGNANQFQTMDATSNGISTKPAYGKVVTVNDRALENAVVIVSLPGTYSLMSLTKTTGEWLIPLNNIYEQESGKARTATSREKVTIEIYSDEGMKSNIDTDFSSMSPLGQTIVMGKDYRLINQSDSVLGETTIADESVPSSGKQIDILFPKEGVPIPGKSPLIKGTAYPQSDIIVNVNSPKSYSFRTKADKDGMWSVLMPEELLPGEHTITMITKNKEGKETTLSRKFIIAKSGEQVLGNATGSATPTVVSIPSITLQPVLSPTAVLTLTPPRSGGNILPLGLTSSSFIIIGLGLLLAF